jgi:hypothetical protein
VLLVYGLLVPILIDRLSPTTVSGSRWGGSVVAAVLVVSLVSGALAVRHAFEIADGAVLMLTVVKLSPAALSAPVERPPRASQTIELVPETAYSTRLTFDICAQPGDRAEGARYGLRFGPFEYRSTSVVRSGAS